MNPCRICGDPRCLGPGLRDYSTWDDLVAHNDFAQITRWVNELWERKSKNAAAHKKYNTKQQLFAKIARQQLDPDEVAEVEKQASKASKGIQI